jgi:hypothetical protein
LALEFVKSTIVFNPLARYMHTYMHICTFTHMGDEKEEEERLESATASVCIYVCVCVTINPRVPCSKTRVSCSHVPSSARVADTNGQKR